MIRYFLLVAILIFLTFIFPVEGITAEEKSSDSNSVSGEILCLPNPPNYSAHGCAKLGPSAYISRMSDLGISFPFRVENGTQPDQSLTNVDFRYGEVTRENAKVYASLEDAIKNGEVVRRVNSPYSFISYYDEAVVDGKRYYMVDYGGWMTANDISRIGTPSLFQGRAFTHTPEHSFGWIAFPTETKRSPGFGTDDYTGREPLPLPGCTNILNR